MVVQLEAHSQHGVSLVIFTLADFEQALTEITAEIQCRSNLGRRRLIARLVKLLTELPA